MRIQAVKRKKMATLWVLGILLAMNFDAGFADEATTQAAAAPVGSTSASTDKPQSPEMEADAKAQATTAPVVKEPTEPEASFDLLELRIKGNTMLEDTVIERTVYPYLGPKKNIETVESARSGLEDAYHNKGYQTVVVDIPEQDVENGVVTLQVIEGKVSQLRVTDSRYFSLGKIKAGVPELAEGKVPNMPVMQKQLEALSAQSEDRAITPILRAGDTPGTLEVDLKVKDELPLHGRIELNGRNTSATSRLRLVNSLHYDNLWQKMHSGSLMYQVSPENSEEVDVWAGTYAMPIPETDAKLALYAVSSSSKAQVAQVGGTTIIGIGEIYGLRLIKPLPGFDDYSHSLTIGVDYKNFKEDTKSGNEPLRHTPISYLPFLVEYSSSMFDKAWQASLTLGVNFGIRGLVSDANTYGKNEKGEPVIVGEFEDKRRGARPNYAYLSAEASFSHDLPYEMQFVSRFAGQVADSPLISNEQFSLGGMTSVRGYFETQALADDGITASLELKSPRLLPISIDYVNKFQALAFLDGGFGRIQQPQNGQPENYSLVSTGVGVRFQVWKYFQGVLDLGFPLLTLDPVKAGHPKLHFSIATEF
jgi:hemolysin activation/secretion protein